MYEQLSNLLVQIISQGLNIIGNKLIPLVGVGGSVESVEVVEIKTIVYAVALLAVLGVIFGIALAIVASKFVVKVDPKVDQVRETLPGANCGACGFAGCMGYAEAVVGNPDVAPNLCAPGKSPVAQKIAQITGKAAGAVDPKIARVFCQGGRSKSQR